MNGRGGRAALHSNAVSVGVAVAAWVVVSFLIPAARGEPGSGLHRPPGPGSGPLQGGAASIQAFAVVGDQFVYAGSFGAGMFRSEDRGAKWVSAGEGLTDPFVLSMAVGQDHTVYAGTFRGGVFRRKPSGSSWEPLNDGLKRLEVKALLVSHGQVFAGTADGVYRLKEGATSWTMVGPGLDDTLVHALGRAQDGTLFAGTSGKGVLRHRQQKPGWVRLRQGLKDHEGLVENYIRVITMSEKQDLYIGTFDGGVFHSGDQGETWKPISRALPNDSIRGIVSSDRRLIVATGHGIFKTENNGQKWVPLNKGLTELSIQALVASGSSTLYAGTNGGAFRSDDDGGTWVQINDGLQVTSDVPFTFQ